MLFVSIFPKFLRAVLKIGFLTVFLSNTPSYAHTGNLSWEFESEEVIFVPTLTESPGYSDNGGYWSILSGNSLETQSDFGFTASHNGFLSAYEDQTSGAGRQKQVTQQFRLISDVNNDIVVQSPGIKLKGHGHISGSAGSSGGPESSASSNITVCGSYYIGDSISKGAAGDSGTASYDNSLEEWRFGTTSWTTNPISEEAWNQLPEYIRVAILAMGINLGLPNYLGTVSYALYAGVNGWRSYDTSPENYYFAVSQVGYKNVTISTQ